MLDPHRIYADAERHGATIAHVRALADHISELHNELCGTIAQLREALMLIPNAEDRAALALYTNELESRL